MLWRAGALAWWLAEYDLMDCRYRELSRNGYSATIRYMTSDPLKHLLDLLPESPTPDQVLPRFISGPRGAPDKTGERGWFDVLRQTKMECRREANTARRS
jgi:hypothetical protein